MGMQMSPIEESYRRAFTQHASTELYKYQRALYKSNTKETDKE
jgi:hypothetical protein